ncbi:MAG: hypothetical protein V9G11_06875 [Bifidobacterium adolescentis]
MYGYFFVGWRWRGQRPLVKQRPQRDQLKLWQMLLHHAEATGAGQNHLGLAHRPMIGAKPIQRNAKQIIAASPLGGRAATPQHQPHVGVQLGSRKSAYTRSTYSGDDALKLTAREEDIVAGLLARLMADMAEIFRC